MLYCVNVFKWGVSIVYSSKKVAFWYQGWPSLITETIDVMIQPQRQKISTNKFQCNDHYVFWWVDIHQRLKNKQKKEHCLRPLPHWLWSYPLIQFNFTENSQQYQKWWPGMLWMEILLGIWAVACCLLILHWQAEIYRPHLE